MPMISMKCTNCSAEYSVRAYRASITKFCSRPCRASWNVRNNPKHLGRKGTPAPWAIGNKHAAGRGPNKTSFSAGQSPWNKNMKGIHLSPSSEFRPGHSANPVLEIGSETVRVDKQGHPRAWVKVAMPNKWVPRAVKVWTDIFGDVPEGCAIHHVNRDTLNDAIGNLQCLTRAEHAREHALDIKINSL